MKRYSRLLFMSLVVVFLSTVAIHGIPVLFAGAQSAPPNSALPPNCTPAQIDKVGASGYDAGNDDTTPIKTVDKRFDTRWSNYGVGSFIQYELKSSDTICGIDISWYRGDVRTYNFIVSTSQDGNKFDNAFFATSSGKTNSLERYIIPDSTLKAKHVRITVNGNTENQWAAVTEVQILSQSTPLPVTPETPPPVTPVTTTPPPPTSECPCPPVTPLTPPPVTPLTPPPVTPLTPPPSKDVFGVTKIYADKPNGEKWFMNMADPTHDPRYDPKTPLKKNPDGSWKVTDSQVRMNVFTSTGYDESKIQTYKQSELATKGYMEAPNDWKNIEMTGYVKINSASDSDFHFTWYGRGGHHGDTPCEGTAYKGNLNKDGSSRFAKEQWHSGGYSFTPTTNVLKTPIVGKWIGYKAVIYNTVVDGKDAVKLENWVDMNANDVWTKIYGYTDSKGLGSDGTDCGGTPDQLISWGGPIADFRWDGTSNIDVKNLSVREISPP
jgi:hypothetical protein